MSRPGALQVVPQSVGKLVEPMPDSLDSLAHSQGPMMVVLLLPQYRHELCRGVSVSKRIEQ